MEASSNTKNSLDKFVTGNSLLRTISFILSAILILATLTGSYFTLKAVVSQNSIGIIRNETKIEALDKGKNDSEKRLAVLEFQYNQIDKKLDEINNSIKDLKK